MIDVLLQGKFPTFTYVRAAPDSDRVETRVGVSAVKFSAAYEDFIACRNQLLPYGLDDLQDRVLYFHKGSSSLDGNAIREVGKLVNLLREMPDVRVAIGSVTAGILKADSKWFRKRADSIINYLNTNGIARKRIAVQSDLRRDRGNDVIRLYVFGPDVLRWFFYRKGNIRLNTAEKRRLDLLAKYLLVSSRQAADQQPHRQQGLPGEQQGHFQKTRRGHPAISGEQGCRRVENPHQGLW